MIIQTSESEKKADEGDFENSTLDVNGRTDSYRPNHDADHSHLHPPPYEAAAQRNSQNAYSSAFAPRLSTHTSAFASSSIATSSSTRSNGSKSSVGLPPASSQPPPSFSRPPPPDIPEPAFAPTFLIANGKYLDKGFPSVPPPSASHPHPFVTHDVSEEDWSRFLEDITRAGSLTEKQKMNADHIPIVSIVPILGWLSAHAVKTIMKKNKVGPVADLVDSWNHYFFNPRKIDIVLMRGTERLNNTNNMMPPSANATPSDNAMKPPDSAQSSHGPLADQQNKPMKGKEKEKEDKNDKTLRLYVNPYFD